MGTPDNDIVSMDWITPVPTPVDTEARFHIVCSLALQLAIRCVHAETERDMLARRLQELTAPEPDEKITALSDGITAAIRAMQAQGIR